MKATGIVFIFLGPPGAGKGSIAQLAEKERGFITLSTGNLCRKLMAQPTPLGKKIATIVQSGNLIPDALMIEMVQQWLDEHQVQAQGFIFDGFPRTVEQVHALDQLLQEHFPHLKPVVVNFVIDDATVVARIASRLVCTNKDCQQVYSAAADGISNPRNDMICDRCGSALVRRKDDQEAAVRHRLQVYHTYASDVLSLYKQNDVPIISLKVDKPLEQVFAQFEQNIDRIAHSELRVTASGRTAAGKGARLTAASRRRRTE